MKTTLKEAERKLRYYQRLVKRLKQEPYDVLHAYDAKNKKSERGKVPLEPPKGEKGKEKESSSSSSARAREIFDEEFLREWKIPSDFVAYWRIVAKDIDIYDAKQSLLNYWSHSESDKAWQLFKRSHAKQAHPAIKVYPLSDWELCAERCANFQNGKCTRGITTPPNCNSPRPFPPHECPHYAGGAQ